MNPLDAAFCAAVRSVHESRYSNSSDYVSTRQDYSYSVPQSAPHHYSSNSTGLSQSDSYLYAPPPPVIETPVFQSQRYDFDPGFFGGVSPPSSNRGFKNFYQTHIASDIERNPYASLEQVTQNGIEQVPDVISRQNEYLTDSNGTEAMEFAALTARTFGGKSFAPRLTARAVGEQYNAKKFGLKSKHRDAEFQQKMHEASGTDTASILKKGSNYARNRALKPVKEEAKKEVFSWAKDKALDAYGTVSEAYPKATSEATDFVLTNGAHMKAMGHPIAHTVVAGRHGWQGAAETATRLGKQREICREKAQDVHTSMVKKIARKLHISKEEKEEE